MKLVPRKNNTSAFTLIELLIVIVIIAVLVAILVPVVNAAIERGRRASCQSNLRQIGAAMINFSADHSGFFPLVSGSTYPPRYSGNPPALGGQWPLTRVVLEMYNKKYLTDLGVWVCPSDKGEGPNNSQSVSKANDITRFNSYGNASYMYVAGMSSTLPITSPSRAAVLLDESSERERGDRSPDGMPDITAIDNHGANYRNVFYFDGHVRAIEGDNVANLAIFPRGTNSWYYVAGNNESLRYRLVNSID
jgi:prepilin-type N-terminal cleavage/methylation domain-containing protein/prepilin-type processing-associated H-X9-DG protein